VNGIAALVKTAVHCSDTLGLEVMGIGRDGHAPQHSCKLEMCGQWLAFYVVWDNDWIFLDVALMDQGDRPERLLSIADNPENWATVCEIIGALERNQSRSLAKPITVGSGPPSGFTIG
jgi:hypothetical protein